MGLLSGLKWYDWVWWPWTVGKWAYLRATRDKNPSPGRGIQSSCYGRPLPLVYGKTRIGGNVIYRGDASYGDRNAAPRPFFAVLIALAEGEINDVPWMYFEGQRWRVLSPYYTALLGTRPTQTAWSRLPSGKDLGYPGVALMAALHNVQDFSFGGLQFEIKGLLHGTGDGTTGDADPAQVIADLLSSNYWGAGFTPDVVTATGLSGGVASSYSRWVDQMDLWVSPAFTEVKPVSEHIREILDATWADALWSDGDLKILPLGDTAVGTYTPYLTAQYALTDDDLIRDGGDPVEVERASESDVYNCAPVNFLDRSPEGVADDPDLAYNQGTVEDPDPLHSMTYGLKRAPTVTMESICLRDVALKISRLRAQRGIYQRNGYAFSLPWRFCLLEPFDIVTIPVAGLTKTVRILSIRESDDHSRLEIEAEDLTVGVSSAVAHSVQSSDGGSIGTSDVQTAQHEKAATSWTPRAITGTYHGACWHDATKVFVAVGGDPGGTRCAWAVHGSDWTVPTVPPSGVMYAVASDGATVVSVGASVGSYSSDGDTWVSATTAPANTVRHVVATGTDSFCAVGGPAAYYTTDGGDTWTAATGWPSGGGAWTQAHGVSRDSESGRLVAIGGDSSGAWESYYSDDDGATWTGGTDLPRQSGVGDTEGYYALAWGNGVFVAVGANDRNATTFDGVTWTESDTPIAEPDGNPWVDVAFTGRVFVALSVKASFSYTGNKTLTSRDGELWSAAQSVGWSANLNVVAWGPIGGVMVGKGNSAASSSPVSTY